MSGHEPNDAAAGIPLKAHVDELRSRCEAVARFQGGSTHYLEDLAIFRTYAAEKGFILAQPPAELSRTPDDEGNEHQVWFVTDSFSAFLGDLRAFAVKNSSSSNRNVAISDTHRGNLILIDDGLLAPIDLRVQSLSSALLDTVVKHCQSA